MQGEAADDDGLSDLLSAPWWAECVLRHFSVPWWVCLLFASQTSLWIQSLPKPNRLRLDSQGPGKDIGVERKRERAREG